MIDDQLATAATFDWITLVIVVGVLAVIIAAVIVARHLARERSKVDLMHAFVNLRIRVPKEAPEAGTTSADWREQLAAYETLFVTLGGVTWRPGGNKINELWYQFWYGRHDHISLEMVSIDGEISFYIVAPRAIQQLLELQLLAQYPKAQIEEVNDYNLFGPQTYVYGTTMQLTKAAIYQIRTYKRLDSDPLNALTMALSKVQKGEGAVIQIAIRPKRRGWERKGHTIAKQMHEEGSTKQSGSSPLGFLTASFKTSDPYQTQRLSGGPTMLTPQEQEMIRSLEEKSGKPGFEVNIRVVTSSPLERNARVHLENIVNAFSQYHAPESGASFRRTSVRSSGSVIHDTIYRNFNSTTMVLNSEEVNSLYHLPLPSNETPNIVWLQAKQAPAPVNIPLEGIVLGHNLYRGKDTVIRIRPVDRRRHVYIIGTTGSGKTVMMQEMAKQDIRRGEGVCIVDPHGSFVDDVLPCIPPKRLHDIVIFDPADTERPVGLNMLEARHLEERDFAVQEMIAIFMKLFPPEMIGPMFEHNMRNAMLTLMEDTDSPGTIADIPRIFTDKGFQQYKLSKVKDPIVRAFWEKEMAKTSDFHKSEMLGYLISKVGRFVENAMMRNIIGQPKSGFNFREIMDQRKILLVNLSKGKIGEVNAALLGLIIVSKLQMAALGRADVSESQRPDFYLYIDEFQNFITDSIATILSEARKYKLNLTMAHQYMGQLSTANDTRVRDAVLGNVGTMAAFRIGVEDAEILEKQFAPTFSAFDLVNQQRYTAYIRLLIDNTAATPFHMQTYPPSTGDLKFAQAAKEYSRLRYGKDRRIVEAEILERTKLGAAQTAAVPLPPEPSR